MEEDEKMKRLAVLLVCTIALTGILAACGPAPQPEVIEKVVTREVEKLVTQVVQQQVEKVVTATPEPEATPPPPPSGKIVVWGWEAALNDTLEGSGVLDDFKAAYPDIEVEFLVQRPTDVYTNLPLALTAGGDVPDVVLVENSHLAQFVHMGGGTGLMNLTDRVTPYVEQMNDYKWADCTLDGKYYCMPWDSGPVVMYYRRDVFEAAGLPSDPEDVTRTIATWDDYLEACTAIKEKTGAYCFAHNKANNYARLYEMILWEQGLGYYDLETGEVTVDSPENIATLEMLGKFWESDLVSDNLEWTDPWYAELGTVELSAHPIATIVEAAWMEVFMKDWISPGTAGLWGVAYMPSVTGAGPRTANDGGSAFVIPAQSPNPEAAWAFVEFTLGSRENQLKMFEVSGFIPSLETTYDDELFEQGQDFFAGQNTFEIYADAVMKIPSAGIYGPDYDMMNSAVALAVQRYATGELSAEEALQDAAAEIRAGIE
jgi:ABC-type glycerol-3-phosphate transport system substrate-binding protein